MMSIQPYTRNMNQVLTYWAPTGEVRFGSPVYAEPILVACRWQGRAVSFMDSAGEQRVSRAVIYSAQELAVGGIVALGSHAADSRKPTEIPEAQRVAQVGSSPTLRANLVLHKVWI